MALRPTYPVPRPSQGPVTKQDTGLVVPARSGVAGRRFDGVADGLEGSFSTQLNNGFSLAMLWRRRNPALVSSVVGGVHTSTGSTHVILGYGNANQLRFLAGGATPNDMFHGSLTVTVSDAWMIMGVSKADGTATPRGHLWKNGAWSHADFSGTMTDTTSTAAKVMISRTGTAPTYTAGDFAVFGVWTTVLTDGDYEALTTNLATQDWADLSPVGLWDFSQATATTVPDLVGSADLSTLTGTSVVDDGPAGWTYGAITTLGPLGTISNTDTTKYGAALGAQSNGATYDGSTLGAVASTIDYP